MKNILLIFSLLVCYEVHGQWTRLEVKGTAINIFEHNKKLYCTALGGLFVSVDDGVNWNRISNSGPPATSNTVVYNSLIDNGNIYGNFGLTPWKTVDLGKHWLPLITDAPCGTYAVAGSEIMALTDPPLNNLRFSLDNGQSWKDITGSMPKFSPNAASYLLSFSNKFYLLNLVEGVLYCTNSKGANWDTCFANKKINRINASEDKLFAITGQDFYESNDAGASWNVKSIPEEPEYITAKGDTLYAAIDIGTIYRSFDNGTNWTKLPFDPNLFRGFHAKRKVFINHKGYLYVPSTFGVSYSKDKGNTWIPAIYEGFTTLGSRKVSAIDTHLIATFETSIVTNISTDLGNIWETSYPIDNFGDVIVVDGMTYIDSKTDIYSSPNLGRSWNKLHVDTIADYVSFANIGKTVFVYLGSTGTYKSNDKGITWTKTKGTGLSKFRYPAKIAADGKQLYFINAEGVLFTSNDEGENWKEINSNLPNFQGFRYLFCRPGKLVAVTATELFLSADSGNSWRSINNGQILNNIKDVLFYENKIITGTLPLYISNDDITEWYEVPDTGQFFTGDNQGMTLLKDQLYIATRYSGLYKRKLSEIMTVSNKEVEVEATTIFPNPVGDLLQIDLTEAFEYSIADASGKLISARRTGINPILVAQLDGGIYFMTLYTAKGKMTQKLVKQ